MQIDTRCLRAASLYFVSEITEFRERKRMIFKISPSLGLTLDKHKIVLVEDKKSRIDLAMQYHVSHLPTPMKILEQIAHAIPDFWVSFQRFKHLLNSGRACVFSKRQVKS